MPNASVVGLNLIAAPVPLSATFNVGCNGSLLLMLKLADRAPEAVGVKVTLMAQLAPAARLAPQVADSPKSPGFAPVNPMLVMVKGAVPVLDRVAVFAALVVLAFWSGNVNDVGDTPATGAVPVPVSDALTVGFRASLLPTVSVADRAPVADGVNVTLMAQFAPPPTLAPQVFVWVKSPLLVPVTVMPVMFTGVGL